ncbi:MAG: hypothetical protein ACSW8D_17165, partial [Prevotella sp.]
ASYQRRRLSAHLNATWQDISRNRQAGTDYDYALNIPTITANGIVAWQATRNLRLHTHIGFEGRQHANYIDIIYYAIYQGTVIAYMNRSVALKEYLSDPNHDPEVAQKMMNEVEYISSTAKAMEEKTNVSETLSPRAIVDLGATYQWRNLTLTANVKNLFNHHYRQGGMSTCLVPQRGRWLMFEIAYKF